MAHIQVYKIYRRVCPDEAGREKIKLQIAQSQSATAALKAAEEKAQKEADLKKALLQNANDHKNSSGIPAGCQKGSVCTCYGCWC